MLREYKKKEISEQRTKHVKIEQQSTNLFYSNSPDPRADAEASSVTKTKKKNAGTCKKVKGHRARDGTNSSVVA